ncbi:carbonic anhydrase [Methylobacterium nodulans]|uniref:carbonic anhydrase n=1 Tax=Methylobacterium nodulans (strain LMG 21967 / CNCM I-2342 / ORS 2060) TaxID=460265 RepID=B8ILR9_METNO|nr:carbonic anhydrase [Methylobacterium nodulans]ACL62044.1 carbonic anhydrase [Methylobacterium nodulans ORS 2060]
MCDDHRLHFSRRGMLMAGAAAWAALPVLPSVAQQNAAPAALSPDAAIRRLMDGNGRYVANSPANKDFSAGRVARVAKQHPFAAILSCADSRVAPELAFDEGPGELFVVRVAGNFVNDDGLASLEYGVKFLGIPLIMVLGHTNCGAVDATIKVLQDKATLPGHLPALVNSIKPAVEVAKKTAAPNLLDAAITENVRYNVERLKQAGPILSGFVADGKAKVVGGVYDLASGKVSLV